MYAIWQPVVRDVPRPGYYGATIFRLCMPTPSEEERRMLIAPLRTQDAHTQWGEGRMRKRSRTDNYMHTCFSRNGTEWLSSNQIERGLLYLLHRSHTPDCHGCTAYHRYTRRAVATNWLQLEPCTAFSECKPAYAQDMEQTAAVHITTQ